MRVIVRGRGTVIQIVTAVAPALDGQVVASYDDNHEQYHYHCDIVQQDGFGARVDALRWEENRGWNCNQDGDSEGHPPPAPWARYVPQKMVKFLEDIEPYGDAVYFDDVPEDVTFSITRGVQEFSDPSLPYPPFEG